MNKHEYAVLSILDLLFRSAHNQVSITSMQRDLGLTAHEVTASVAHLRTRGLLQEQALRLTLRGLAVASAFEGQRSAQGNVA